MSAYTMHAGEFIPAGGIRFRTTREIAWELWVKGSGNWFRVDAGTVFDCSIPRFLRWVLDPRDRRFLKAACLHDEMLRRGVDRTRAAAEFNLALKADGVGKGERLAMFIAVAIWRFR